MKTNITLKPLVAALMLTSVTATHAEIESVNSIQPMPEQIKQAINSNDLVLAVGIFDPKHESLNFQNRGLNQIASQNYGIVQFEAGKHDFEWLAKHDFKVIQSFSNHAYVVNWSRANQALLQQHPDIRWYGNYQSGFKVSPNLWEGQRASLSSYPMIYKPCWKKPALLCQS